MQHVECGGDQTILIALMDKLRGLHGYYFYGRFHLKGERNKNLAGGIQFILVDTEVKLSLVFAASLGWTPLYGRPCAAAAMQAL